MAKVYQEAGDTKKSEVYRAKFENLATERLSLNFRNFATSGLPVRQIGFGIWWQ